MATNKRKNVSVVWKVFDKCFSNENFAVCSICNKEYTTSGNTSNLMDHIRRKHPEELARDDIHALAKKNGQTLISQKSFLYGTNSAKKKTMNTKIALMIATDLQPYSFVEDEGFLKLIKYMDPCYQVPCKKTFAESIIPQLYAEMKKTLQNILKEIEYMSFTADMWTSINSESYCCITLHFVLNHKLQSCLLKATVLPGSHTAECIADFIQECFCEWQIDLKKIVCATTDNGANVKSACINKLKISHLPCFAHSLNLCVNDVISSDENLNHLLSKCRNIVTFFKRSNVAMDLLRQEQDRINMPHLKLIKDVDTRWNSIFFMLRRIIEIGDPLTMAQCKSKNAPPLLEVDDISTIHELIQILNPLNDATVKLSGEKYCTISLIIPAVNGIYINIAKLVTSTAIATNVKQLLLNSISKRLFPYEKRQTLQMATLLDPRMKTAAFHNSENARDAKKLFQDVLSSIVQQQKESQKLQSSPSREPSTSKEQTEEMVDTETESEQSKGSNNNDLFSFIIQHNKTVNEAKNSTSEGIIIARQYFSESSVGMHIEPISYWLNTNSSSMKSEEYDNKIYFQKLVKKYFCIPATSVPSERLFSKAGNLITIKRSKLKSKNVNMLLFINQNKWLLPYVL